MLNPPHPPRIEYELEISPTVISLSNPSPIKISVRFRLCEPRKYTVMWRKSTTWGMHLALAAVQIAFFNFDIFDTSTGEKVSGIPWIVTSQVGTKLSRSPMIREQLGELYPYQTYTGEAELNFGEDESKPFKRFFRVTDYSTLFNRKLGVRLRPMDTFGSTKGIDELFENEDTIVRDYWYIPLTIQSPATADLAVVS